MKSFLGVLKRLGCFLKPFRRIDRKSPASPSTFLIPLAEQINNLLKGRLYYHFYKVESLDSDIATVNLIGGRRLVVTRRIEGKYWMVPQKHIQSPEVSYWSPWNTTPNRRCLDIDSEEKLGETIVALHNKVLEEYRKGCPDEPENVVPEKDSNYDKNDLDWR